MLKLQKMRYRYKRMFNKTMIPYTYCSMMFCYSASKKKKYTLDDAKKELLGFLELCHSYLQRDYILYKRKYYLATCTAKSSRCEDTEQKIVLEQEKEWI